MRAFGAAVPFVTPIGVFDEGTGGGSMRSECRSSSECRDDDDPEDGPTVAAR